MNTILDALQEGRLFELPDNDKEDALQFLAHIIEAFPEVPAGTDLVGHVMERENAVNTALGKGWACPHARVSFDEDLMCVIGWSPTGIDYGSKDGEPVSLVIMYLVPENQRNQYLREISVLAKSIESYPKLDNLRSVQDLDDIRNYLLDLVDVTKESPGTEMRSRMIRLQTKAAVADPVAFEDLSNLLIEPLTLIGGEDRRPVVLTQNADLLQLLENSEDIIEHLEEDGTFRVKGWRVLRRGAAVYQGGWTSYDCVAASLA